jgi:hypothetical protein
MRFPIIHQTVSKSYSDAWFLLFLAGWDRVYMEELYNRHLLPCISFIDDHFGHIFQMMPAKMNGNCRNSCRSVTFRHRGVIVFIFYDALNISLFPAG